MGKCLHLLKIHSPAKINLFNSQLTLHSIQKQIFNQEFKVDLHQWFKVEPQQENHFKLDLHQDFLEIQQGFKAKSSQEFFRKEIKVEVHLNKQIFQINLEKSFHNQVYSFRHKNKNNMNLMKWKLKMIKRN